MGCWLSRDGRRRMVKEEPLAVKRSPEKEVETVKEILSETPTPPAKPAAEIKLAEVDQTSSVEKAPKLERVEEAEASPAKRETPGIEGVVNETKSLKQPPVTDEVSDASEAYSFNESRSTTTVTEIRDEMDEVEVGTSQVKHRLNRGSAQRLATRPSNRHLQTRNVVVSGSKARRESNQSPVRKPAEARRAVGESPVRRTVSPSARRVNGPRPIKPGPTGPYKVGHGRTEESLENPLVSLECFIFL